jgi:Flp pilus assembly protein TadD
MEFILEKATTGGKKTMKGLIKIGSLLLVASLLLTALAGCGGSMSVEEHFQQGNQYAEAGEFGKAIEEYQAVLQEDPENVSAMTNLGVAYYNNGQLAEAIAQYENALDLAPNDADIHSNLAAAYVQQHQTSGDAQQLTQARQQYEKAVELKPDLAEAYFGLGVVHILAGNNEQAIEAFEQFLQVDTGKDSIASQQAQEYLRQLKGQ